ncbi:MAG: bifunctional alpha,alpha-trehalose-phosphate synthase (UDP-forming)/trehalose-phosphatase [Chitinispirillaceae bacterium]|nr:bifunctional alpha,alpha-trehalose-phosphate synthase (UDP-forming)/trehalose-phosphatase [Chitinispirillaceae bacterium]
MRIITPSRFKRIVIVSYRLPFSIVVKGGKKTIRRNQGGLVSAIAALSEKMTDAGSTELFKKIVWVGKSSKKLQTVNARRIASAKGLSDKPVSGVANISNGPVSHPYAENTIYQLVPVAIKRSIDEKYYGGFCNDCIWPLFHYFPSLAVHDESYFENYIHANKLFAEKLKTMVRPDDFIWVHDYHLFLLPGFIREAFPAATIGFFLHIPFPSFEIFRIMPKHWRNSILRGMLGADLIGFHTNDYSQYFLRSVSRLLGLETTMNSVTADGRFVKVDAFPIGIDYDKFNGAAMNSREVKEEEQKILSTLQNKKLIFSVDRLDYTKGLVNRIEAFEYFLETHPQWMEKIVFNMVVIPSRDSIPQYRNMKREIEAIVGKINGKYATMAWRPIIYQYKSLSFNELVAHYNVSHVGLITPIRDGMNLVAKEYVACQVTGKGVLILSEMAGASSELSEAILINPTNKQEIATAINKALTMSLIHRTVLLTRMQKHIKNYTVFSWAKEILAGVEAVKKEQEIRRVNIMTPAIESAIMTKFTNASRRAIFLDYDGTLVPFSNIPELATPDTPTIKQLKALAINPTNSVVLISGRDKNFLEEWFGTLNIHLIAEHGAFQKSPGGDWLCNIDPDQSWKSTFAPIFQRYTDHCNGSFIEEKFSSLAWHYRNSPAETGQLYAKELKEEIRALVAHENKLHVLEGNMVIELKKTGYDKGIAALKFVSDHIFDFIFAIGDDRTDEDIFRSLPPNAITIKIGITSSIAKYNLATQNDVSRIIERFIEKNHSISEKSRQNVSPDGTAR